jgi:hypothetical protein
MSRRFRRIGICFLILILPVTGCSKKESSSTIKADIILLDISGSSTNAVGTFNSEDHSPSSLSQRKLQLEAKIRSALDDHTAVYFGFVRKSYGSTDIVTLVNSSLILQIDKVLKEDILNEKLLQEAKSAISKAWSQALGMEIKESNSCIAGKVESIIIEGSNAAISEKNSNSIATKLCAAAANSIYQFNQLQGDPENIGSDIQGAIDRSLQKLASDERRLITSDGHQLAFIPRIILVSDLIQVSNGKSVTSAINAMKDKAAACKLAQKEASTFTPSYEGDVEIISDGFAGSKADIKNADRDKLMEYWKCWFGTRQINQIDIGAKGIDLGAL